MFIENTEELANNKLLLLYLIDRSSESLGNSKITEFMLEKDYMNYFLVQQFLSELVDSDFIILREDNTYLITKKGQVALSYFEDRILSEFKDDVNTKFKKTVRDKKIETEVVSDSYKKENDQYVVNLKLVENEEVIFSVYIDVSNKKQADSIAENWKENTEYIYLNIINILTEKKSSDK